MNSSDPAVASGDAATSRPETTHHKLEFSGSGREYFGIWIVNLLLSVVTLGIYSAWAKVRRLQYFYRNTTLAGACFDYHGPPLGILKGRIIGVALFALYNFSFQVSPIFGGVCFVALAAVMPWLLQRSLRFSLHYSSYRGLRFRFGGSVSDSYVVFLVLPFVVLITLYIAAPLMHHQLKRYQHGNSYFGDLRFSFDAKVGAFYKVYLVAAGLALAALVGAAVIVAMFAGGLSGLDPQDTASRATFGILPLVIFGVMLFAMATIGPYFLARIQNLVWCHTQLGTHRFESRVSARKLIGIHLTNLLGIVFTLGLYKPFAAVRMARYRLACMSLVAAGSLDGIAAAPSVALGATGEETAEIFNIDIGL